MGALVMGGAAVQEMRKQLQQIEDWDGMRRIAPDLDRCFILNQRASGLSTGTAANAFTAAAAATRQLF